MHTAFEFRRKTFISVLQIDRYISASALKHGFGISVDRHVDIPAGGSKLHPFGPDALSTQVRTVQIRGQCLYSHVLQDCIAAFFDQAQFLSEDLLHILKDKGADKVFTAIGTGVLVAKDWVMERVEKISLRATDIYADAKVKADAYLEKKKSDCCGEDCCSRGQED